MDSQTRPRRTRRSYADFFAHDVSNQRNAHNNAGDDTSGSDFDPEAAKTKDVPTEDDSPSEDDSVDEEAYIGMDEDDEGDDLQTIVISPPAKPTRKAKTKDTSKRRKKEQKKPAEVPASGQSLTVASRPQKPGPGPSSHLMSKDHRYRPESPWYPPTDVYRLTKAPRPCQNSIMALTVSTAYPKVNHRVKKAWMYCVSAGPCWELLEDRAFFKEEYMQYDHLSGNGRQLRPIVYPELLERRNYTVLSATEATQYLPHANSIRCELGPLGSQQLLEFAPFSSVPMRLLRDDDDSHMFYPGGSVMGADWCPFTPSNRQTLDGMLYFAISTLSESPKSVPLGLRYPTPNPASIQIWSIGKSTDANKPGIHVQSQLLLCIDQGCALQIKWCPLPSHSVKGKDSPGGNRLGVLGAVTMDGNVNIYIVPDPAFLEAHERPPGPGFGYVKTTPTVQLSLPDTSCTTIDWANSEVIATGCSNGYVAIFYVKDAICNGGDAVLTHYFNAHQSAIQDICWIRLPRIGTDIVPSLTEDPCMVCTVGTEGALKVTDIRECLPRALVRNREVPHSNTYSSFCGAVIATDVDFVVKMYQLQSAAFGKGHQVMDIGGAALSVSASDMHPIIAAGSADGACTTTNILRGTRREGAVPLLNHKIFQLDFNPTTNRYRILDHFLPKESGTSEGPAYRESAPRVKANDDAEATKRRFETGQPEPSGLWHPSVAVNVVTWNSGCGLESGPFLLSGMACGLARIDFLEGMWMRNTLPYGSVDMIRQGSGDDSASESQSE